MDNIAIVINGKGAVGKDTFCAFVLNEFKGDNISSITPIKELAKVCGWNGGKEDKDRKFLSDLKKVTTDYNDYANNYLLSYEQKFLESGGGILFVHIREPKEIAKFVQTSNIDCVTLLIKKPNRDSNKMFGNDSDDNVENYNYDYTIYNDSTLESLNEKARQFIKELIADKGLLL